MMEQMKVNLLRVLLLALYWYSYMLHCIEFALELIAV